MTLIPEISFPLGKYVVSPSTHLTEAGEYRASVSIQSGQGSSSHCRVMRFDRMFASREGARLFAITQGWLQAQASSLRAAAC